MRKQVSFQYTQLTLDFEYEATTTAPSIATTHAIALAAQASKVECHFTQADYEESQAIEHDIMYGRGAYLYKEVERELAFQREQAKILRQFEAMQASMYQ